MNIRAYARLGGLLAPSTPRQDYAALHPQFCVMLGY